VWETDYGEHSESRDAALCAGDLFVSLYNEMYIPVLDPGTGREIDRLDLSLAFRESDRKVAYQYTADLVEIQGQLIVSLQTPDFSASGDDFYRDRYYPGALIQIDCLSRKVVASWTVAEWPVLVPVPGSSSEVLFFDRNWTEDYWALQTLN
jgi:hypothetical protein